MVKFLQENNDLFVRSAADMSGIDPEMITHKLNVDLNRKTMKQKKRSFTPKRSYLSKGKGILGSFPIATAQRKFLIIAIDYFTKWIESKPLKITTKQVSQFLWENIMCRYGISRILVTDNGTQFNNEEFRKYREENEIDLRFTSVAHPQVNGQAEVANRIILDGLKKRIEKSRNNWVDEVLSILWAYRTTYRVTTRATPFMVEYGVEVVVPVEISYSSPRIQAYNAEENEEGQRLALDLIDEVLDAAHAKIMEYQKKAFFTIT
ncbi:uncharacterized protein LOC141696041 [Apium graveolens]|uniref:uncharacterized protein LOC141696041 n=1 Tax=Apium graveolens TaxID=4045 RepID=UPI003D7963E7